MPIAASLTPESFLRPHVQTGLSAVKTEHRDGVEGGIRPLFSESLDLDAALSRTYPQEHRWDYLLGYTSKGVVVGLESHHASTSEVSEVIKKKQKAEQQLRGHLRPGVRVVRWYWVSSGKVDFAPYEKSVLRLAQAGITFVGRVLKKKDLPQ